MRALADVALPRALLAALVRRHLELARMERAAVSECELVAEMRGEAEALCRRRVTPVINATGVMIHTNLGRAPLSESAVEAVRAVASGYSSLEYDVASGERGIRGEYCERLLATLCDAPAATLVNNCAAALVLIVRQFCRRGRRRVIISRGELVQIGGGFRIPEMLTASGARLMEVGTTNKTSLADYAAAIDAQTAMILRVHRSNFVMEGFVASPTRVQLAELAREQGIPLVEDLGSGAIDGSWGDEKHHEPTPRDALREGVDLVCFSGDKLLGGPQAGIIAGDDGHVAALKKHPLFRALRCDRMTFAAMQATAEEHLRGGHALRLHQMLAAGKEELRARAEGIRRDVGAVDAEMEIVSSAGRVGGGALPQQQIPSVAMAILPRYLSIEELARRLRMGAPAIVSTLRDGRLLLDLRTVFPDQDAAVVAALRAVLAEGAS